MEQHVKTEYVVEGMTCEHCKMSVTEELKALPGVKGINVDLASGVVIVFGAVRSEDVRAAVEEAGYRVTV